MATYYLNLSAATNGSGNSRVDPFNSLTALPVLAAGDVVEVEPGTSQTMAGSYSVNASGAVGNPITFRANPAIAGAKPRFRIATENGNGLVITARSHIVVENLQFYGDPSWTAQDSVGVFLNGGLTNITLRGVDCRYSRFNLVGGFATNGVYILGCTGLDAQSDGLRWFSGTGTYTWQNVEIRGGEFSRNGIAAGPNGAGLNFYIQPTHTGTTLQGLTVEGVTTDDNYRAGISLINNADDWNAVTLAGNTTPPGRRIVGLLVQANKSRRNGGGGIAVQAAGPSATMGLTIRRNLCTDNSTRTTLGNIWTGGCLSPLIERNECLRANSNGTTIGDGQGIFDDQWNDGAVVRWNVIRDNVYQSATNPDYTAYGIGIYRSANGRHYGNIITGCRHGFVIGYVSGATAPVMTGIVVENNTVADFSQKAVSIWTFPPSNSIILRNNLFVRGAQDIEALSPTSGQQTYTTNAAIAVTTKSTANNVPLNAVDHASHSAAAITGGLAPVVGSSLLGAGTHSGYLRSASGAQRQNPPAIGAFDAAPLVRRAP